VNRVWGDGEKRESEKRPDFMQWSLSPLSPPNTHTTVLWGHTEQGAARDQTTLQMRPQWGQRSTARRSWLHERHL